MSGLGHNQGPTMEPGAGWRRYTWRKARADLLPKLPLEVLRRRVKRARELGLDYKSYASIRAATGHDVVALLFSSNALRLEKSGQMPVLVHEKLANLSRTDRFALVHPPRDPAQIEQINAPLLQGTDRAPGLTANWAVTRDQLRDFLARQNVISDRVVLVRETALEAEWLTAGTLAGSVTAAAYFGPNPPA